MFSLELSEVKMYLRVETNDEDFLISSLITAAKDYCKTYLNRPIVEDEMTTETKWNVPETVNLAMLMLIAHWFEYRGVIGKLDGEISFSVSALLKPHRIISFGSVSQ
jgi:uncharacterized phage protein (predicted DNA packaging)